MPKKLVQRRKPKNIIPENVDNNITGTDFIRLTNNFYNQSNYPTDFNRIVTDSQLFNYITQHKEDTKTKYKVAFVFICLNPLYWQYANEMVQGARQLFLPGHKTDFLFWTDIPEKKEEIEQKIGQAFVDRGIDFRVPENVAFAQGIMDGVASLREQKDIFIFPTESIEWPYPTLLRYNLFLQQEEKLKEYDYIFYCDIDMKFVNVVGDEILGPDLTAAQHPMYALRKEYNPPYEPNPGSSSFITRPGRVVMENNAPRFIPLYYAGGLQGGKTESWIKAMKEMRTMIDTDLSHNYIPIWNDESVWNKYLSQNPPTIVLTPSYIYPDSLIKEYYEPLWGCSYIPKLVTLTKWFSLSKEGGAHVAQIINQTKK